MSGQRTAAAKCALVDLVVVDNALKEMYCNYYIYTKNIYMFKINTFS